MIGEHNRSVGSEDVTEEQQGEATRKKPLLCFCVQQ